jgi:hypothetical protein
MECGGKRSTTPLSPFYSTLLAQSRVNQQIPISQHGPHEDFLRRNPRTFAGDFLRLR